MSHRRPEQYPAGLDGVLRSALRRAVDSVEPAADGLDRIRAKIAAGRDAPHVRWRLAMAAYLETFWQTLGPAGGSLRRAAGAVAVRFRREPGRTDVLGWLRPAAALATGLFVVASASWAIAALPSEIPSLSQGNTHTVQNGGPSGGGGPASASSPSGTGASIGPSSSSSAPKSRTCSPTAAQPSKSGSSSPTTSPSPSPTDTSGSPSGSPSPSPSPSSSDSSTPPTPTPSSSSSAAASQSPGPSASQTQAKQESRLSQFMTSSSSPTLPPAGPCSG